MKIKIALKKKGMNVHHIEILRDFIPICHVHTENRTFSGTW